MSEGKRKELRDEIAQVDRGILELVARRQEISSKLGRLKAEQGLPVRDYVQEKKVIDRARLVARELNLSEETGEKLALQFVRWSLTLQEKDRVTTGGHGDGRRVLVIGGRGRMGGWMCRFLSSQGFAVSVADPAGNLDGFPCVPDWREIPLDDDMIVVAAPLAISGSILLELAKSPPPGLIFDVGSLKSPLRAGLFALRDQGAQVTSIHPMFGPDTQLLSGRHVIFADVGVPEATRSAKKLFASTMAIPVEMDLESHDHLIAHVLGLSHALNIAFVSALRESGEEAPRLLESSSTTFDAQLDVASRVAEENPRLYFEIQKLNDYGDEALTALGRAVENLQALVRTGDEEGFVSLMEKGRAYVATREECVKKRSAEKTDP